MHIPRYTSNELYRRLHVGHPTDIEIYRRLSSGAERVLDLGCGWGRIALTLAEAGYDVVGVDLEEEFLKECREQVRVRGLASRLHVYQADVCAVVLDHYAQAHGPFDRVLLPYNTLYALGGAERVTHCLSALVEHLTPEAEVWFDVYDVDEYHASFDGEEDSSADEEQDPTASWEDSGKTVDVFELSQASCALQQLTVNYQARIRETGQCVGEQTLRHDYLLSNDLDIVFGAAGLELVGCYPRSTLLADPSALPEEREEEDEQLFYLAELRGKNT